MSYINKPYTFTSQTKILSAQVNANFDTVYSGVNALQADTTQRAVNVKYPPSPLAAAVGDGVTDDTAALQAVLNLGGVIIIPAGTYIVNTTLTLPSNITIHGVGRGKTVIKVNNDNVRVFYAATQTNVVIKDLSINGSGSIDNTGKKAGYGVYFDGVQDFTIDNIEVYNMGAMNTASPTSDSIWGGFGIAIKSLQTTTTEARRGVINNCYVHQIAGGGTANGDGIAILGNNNDLTKKGREIIVSNCFVTTCGRHCYSISGGAGTSVPENIIFKDCFAEKASCCGLDIETGNKVSVLNCTFNSCGNDQTFYNPGSAFGTSYRLLYAIATTSTMSEVLIDNCNFYTCYGSVSMGQTLRMTISNCKSNGSLSAVTADYTVLLAGGPQQFIFKNNIIKNCGFSAINMFYVKDAIFEGNIIDTVGVVTATNAFGMKLSCDTDIFADVIFKGNIVKNCPYYGVWFYKIDNILIENNIIKDNGNGIAIESPSGLALIRYIITGNRCYDTRSGASRTQNRGVVFLLSTGSQDYFIITSNDFRNNITANNYSAVGANKVVANNLD